jgi:hypothetical protein
MITTLVSSTLPLFQLNHERTRGRHVSAIIHDLCLRRGIYKRQENDSDSGDEDLDTTWMRLGQAWEHALIAQTRLEHPGEYIELPEIERDGIFGHLDLYKLVHEIDEIKCTRLSSRHELGSIKMWKYGAQLMAYCWMMRCLIGNLKVVFTRGNYSDKLVEYRHWRIVFTKQELWTNWRTLTTHADLMEGEGHQWQA